MHDRDQTGHSDRQLLPTDVIEEVVRREQELGIEPDPVLDAFLKAIAFGNKGNLVVEVGGTCCHLTVQRCLWQPGRCPADVVLSQRGPPTPRPLLGAGCDPGAGARHLRRHAGGQRHAPRH